MKILGIFCGVAMDSAFFLAGEIRDLKAQSRQTTQKHKEAVIGKKYSTSATPTSPMTSAITATVSNKSDVVTSIDPKIPVDAFKPLKLLKMIGQHAALSTSNPRAIWFKDSPADEAPLSKSDRKEKHKFVEATTGMHAQQANSEHINGIRATASTILDGLGHSTSDLVDEAVKMAHRHTAMRKEQLEEIKTKSKEMFSGFFENLDADSPKRKVRPAPKSRFSPRNARHKDLADPVKENKEEPDSSPFFGTRTTQRMK